MCRAVCKIKDIIIQVSAVHDAMVEEYRSDQHKKYISMELRPNAKGDNDKITQNNICPNSF